MSTDDGGERSMRIMLRDGSVFEGTPVEITATMRARHRANHLTLADFSVWFARSLEGVSGLTLHVNGGTDEECAQKLLRALLRQGLAVEERLSWRP